MLLQVQSDHSDPGSSGKTRMLAQRLGAPVVGPDFPWSDDEVRLGYKGGVLSAVAIDDGGSPMTVSVDFLLPTAVGRRRRAGHEMLIKALQGRQRRPLSILDATAGLAADATLVAAAGHDVVALERSQIIFELVSDGLFRAEGAEGFTALTLHRAEALDWLNSDQQRRFDVIYLDPMFAMTSKKALPRKSAQLLRRLCGDSSDAEQLLALARRRADLRVVVKRHVKAEWLGDEPDYCIKGQRVRFDIYQTC